MICMGFTQKSRSQIMPIVSYNLKQEYRKLERKYIPRSKHQKRIFNNPF